MSATVVSKSSPVVVRPSEPVRTGSTIKLSSFDKSVIGLPVTSLFVFDQPIKEPAETIRRALSQALVHYYPISGRLATGGADDLHIHCTGEGVSFIAASASSALQQVKFIDQSPGAKELLDELVMYYDPSECSDLSTPLMKMQVTEFSCGGFIVGVTWNHAIADGRGMAQFLQAVGEIARGPSPPSVVPVRLDDSLPCLPPSASAMDLEPLDLASLDITIPSSAINRIRAEYMSSSSSPGGRQSSCTVFEVVAAMLWRCRTRAIMSNPEAGLAVLSFVADVRRHVGAKDGYYGNCITAGQLVMATSGTVANGDINDVIRLIQHAKEQIPHQFMRNNGSTAGGSDQPPQVVVGGQRELDSGEVRYGALTVSSWRNLGFEDPEFGSGKPARVMCHGKPLASPVPLCLCLPPWKGLDGVNVLSLCVKKEHANTFIAELSRFT